MAHFAELDSNNLVLRVLVVNNEQLLDKDGNESEETGIAFLTSLFGGNWKQTSYNTEGGVHKTGGIPFRKNYAAIGHTYDPVKDAFVAPKPEGDGWTFSEEQCIWRNIALEEAIKATYTGVTRV